MNNYFNYFKSMKQGNSGGLPNRKNSVRYQANGTGINREANSFNKMSKFAQNQKIAKSQLNANIQDNN